MLIRSSSGNPAAGELGIGLVRKAGFDWPTFKNAQGAEKLLMPLMGQTRIGAVFPNGGTAYSGFGMYSGNIAYSGGIGVGPDTTNVARRQPRIAWQTSATAGTLAGFYTSATGQGFFVGNGAGLGGFTHISRIMTGNIKVAGERCFVGLTSSTAIYTNVAPSTLTNVIGFGWDRGVSDNMQLFFGGSSAQAPIDLGASFPINTTNTDLYEVTFHWDPNDNTQLFYHVLRVNTGDVSTGTIANTTPGTTLPATSTMLHLRGWCTNNPTAAATGFHGCFHITYGGD